MAKKFDPKKVIAVIGGIVVEGYAEGTFIEVTRNEDDHTYSGGSDGKGTFNINPNKSGTIKVTLQHNANSVNKLAALGLAGVTIPIVILDNNDGGQKVVGNECVLQKQIDFSRAKEVGNVDITYLCEEVYVLGL